MEHQPDEVFLPSKPELENTDMRLMTWIMYGPPGIGKSTFISQAKDVLFLTTDNSLRFIKSMHRPINNWATFKKYVKMITMERPTQYKSIAIDSVDILFRMCRKYICEKRGIEHQSDEQWGKAYDLTSSEFELEIEKIMGLGLYGMFFTSHSREVEMKTRLGSITKTCPTMPSQVYKILFPIADILAYYGFDGKMTTEGDQSRRIYFQPTENMEAKDRTNMLPESIVIPDPDEVNGFELVEKYLIDGPPAEKQKPAKKLLVRRK